MVDPGTIRQKKTSDELGRWVGEEGMGKRRGMFIWCNPMDCSTPGFSVLHYLPEFAQIYVHWISDAIQPSHSLSSLSPPALNLSQHQGLFQWVGSLHQVAKVLELQIHSAINKNLLYSTGDYIQHLLINPNGKESEIYITESLCCIPETNTVNQLYLNKKEKKHVTKILKIKWS